MIAYSKKVNEQCKYCCVFVNLDSDEVITFVCVYKDGKYRQMALTGFGTQTTELGL